MKRSIAFISGFLAGSILFGGGAVCASGILAEPSVQRFFVDGKEVQMEAFLIEGHNYLKLREVGEAVGFNVYWDEESRTVQVTVDQPYTGNAPEEPDAKEAGVQDEEDFNTAVLTEACTREAFLALRDAIEYGGETLDVYMSEETYQAMIQAAAAVECWPVYDLIAQGNRMYRFQARYPAAYEEVYAYCLPFIESMDDLSEREKVRQIAFFVCDRLEYSANDTATPRTALADDKEHKSNCTGYSICFKFLCDLADIPCILTHSTNHQWNMVYVEGQWWHVNVSGADISDPRLRPKLPVLKTEDELQGSTFTQSQPWLTELAKELMVPGSTK